MGKRSKKRKLKLKLARRAASKHPARRSRKAGYFKNNLGEVVTPIELVFPIVRKKDDGSYEPVGAGFFIHPAGGFVTAKHCLFEKGEYDENCYAIQSFGNGQHVVRKIQYFKPHPVADIGMGMLQGQVKERRTHKEVLRTALVIAKEKPLIDDKIGTLAYPRMRITQNQIGHFPWDQYAGKIVDFHPGGFSLLKTDVTRQILI